jgi:hypothetical protein
MPRLSAQPFHRLRISGTGTGTGTFTGAAGIQGQALEVVASFESKPNACANNLLPGWVTRR